MGLINKVKSYQTIVAPLKKMVEDLRMHAEEKHNEAAAHEAQAEECARLHNLAVDEADAAMETADNIANLIGEPKSTEG